VLLLSYVVSLNDHIVVMLCDVLVHVEVRLYLPGSLLLAIPLHVFVSSLWMSLDVASLHLIG
jgi:hypothetical protein